MLFRGGNSSVGEKWHLTLKQTDMSEYKQAIRTFLVIRLMGSESVVAVEEEVDWF